MGMKKKDRIVAIASNVDLIIDSKNFLNVFTKQSIYCFSIK